MKAGAKLNSMLSLYMNKMLILKELRLTKFLNGHICALPPNQAIAGILE